MTKLNWLYIKIFEKEEYADQFMSGDLYCNRLSYFKDLENNEDGRLDPHEALSAWWQPKDIILELNVPTIGRHTIPTKDFAGPIAISQTVHSYLHLFCLYAIYQPDGDEQFGSKEDLTRAIASRFIIDERCLKLGGHAVLVMHSEKFTNRIISSLKLQNIRASGNYVSYYDDETFSGQIEDAQVPFRKQKKFSYQNEFRLSIEPQDIGTNPRIFSIGNIKDFCLKVKSEELRNILNSMTVQFNK